MIQASCLCGAVRYEMDRPAGAITACHCSQCRKLSGHFAASFDAAPGDVRWLSQESLRVHELPSGASRGFCRACGSKVWFRAADGAWSFEAGLIDGASGGALEEQIFLQDKGDYYEVTG
ncbi:GFA family protein [Pseudoroseicyclus tamaricis]|uniref:GFA family protein n=1 Tax=Pseudoroseicyclus tamaricis TaxID=2705421 RepID=A0A6B2JNK1_9RHOB|nr:GFA family protein [Pseudoroseicyclus tamaricis]NDU99559.1 GFA family protein [Pseudoroseicyclus tamaricis]